MDTSLEPHIRSALEVAGWSPSRIRDPADGLAALESAGYRLWAGLASLLGMLDGLSLSFPRGDDEGDCWFDAERAVHETEREWVSEYERRGGACLAPIGYAYGNYLVILAGENGSFYAGFDDELFDVGSTWQEMTSTIVSGDGFQEVRS